MFSPLASSVLRDTLSRPSKPSTGVLTELSSAHSRNDARVFVVENDISLLKLKTIEFSSALVEQESKFLKKLIEQASTFESEFSSALAEQESKFSKKLAEQESKFSKKLAEQESEFLRQLSELRSLIQPKR